ncbi:MAG: sigma-70 family RNA polymerase sigma factor [Bacteroidetes bacterium]|nr:sigma-70 family RNA polymerase sigma factor [Bacteroidota bacterium]
MDHQAIIHKVCGMYCDNEEDKKDLFQEILINLWKSYPSFRGDSTFTTWMYRVSLNVAFQRLRKTAKNREQVILPSMFDTMKSPGKEGLPIKEKQQMYAAIEKLNEVEKAIVMLYLEEKGNEEIAKIIGISQNYVRVKMTRIRRKLRQIVEE